MRVEWHKLGEYIEECVERNDAGRFGDAELLGVNSQQQFCPSKANTQGIDFRPYKVVHNDEFAYNPARLDIGSIAKFDGEVCIVSTLYEVFRIKEEKRAELLPEFLQMYFAREEFARYVGFKNWGSAREYFWLDAMKRVPIRVPPIAEQRKVVEAWQGLRKMKEENEQLAEPLLALCRSYLQEIKKKYPMKEIGPMIEERNERNKSYEFGADDLQGVACTQHFIKSIATTHEMDFGNHKVVRKGDFAYSNRINVGSIALREDGDCIVSPSYVVFHVKDDALSMLSVDFLRIWYSRSEFLRATLFFAHGTIKDDFSFVSMCRVKIPLPPIEVQQAVVDLYRCANEAKKIAAEADKLSREICPALIQRVVKEVA